MFLTLLFDLDDTLLDTNIEAFLPAYSQGIAECLAPYIPANDLLPLLMASTKMMMANEDPSSTLQDVFEGHFYRNVGSLKNDIIGVMDNFYENIFPRFEAITQRRLGSLVNRVGAFKGVSCGNRNRSALSAKGNISSAAVGRL